MYVYNIIYILSHRLYLCIKIKKYTVVFTVTVNYLYIHIMNPYTLNHYIFQYSNRLRRISM